MYQTAETETYTEIVRKQRAFFHSHTTKDVAFRKNNLIKLRNLILNHEEKFHEAIKLDFGKSAYENQLTELNFLFQEIRYFLKNLNKLTKNQHHRTNLVNFPGKSYIKYEPLGVTLIIGVWNYPSQLVLLPLITAIAAGNTAIIKTSEVAPNTAEALKNMINKNFREEFIHVITGDAETTQSLLRERFDLVFYTGNSHVGRIIYEAAAKNLTPVILELGGKNPAIVTPSTDLKVTANRIIWGKFVNSGQTCIAPDYVLVHKQVCKELLTLMKEEINKNDYNKDSINYTRIVNARHFNRIIKLIDPEKVIIGGESDPDELFISPTLMYPVTWSDEVMQEEIFGPVLPVIEYEDFDQIIQEIKHKEKPLAAYLFTKNRIEERQFLDQLSFGGGCINDVMMQFTNPNLPYGGVGNSGIGHYHGIFGFKSFSHTKSVFKKPFFGELSVKFSPYSDWKLKLIRWLMGGGKKA